MHRLRKMTAGLATAAAVALIATAAPVLSAGGALADPINGSGKAVAPNSYDVVSVGANTDQGLFDQLSLDYNATIPASKHSASHPYFYAWDATKPGTNVSGPNIATKVGCTPILRPNGSGAGLTALDSNTLDGKTGRFCIDFARSSSGRSAKSPPFGPNGVAYVALAQDAVTWAVRDTGAAKGQPETYAPKSLTVAQLAAIFSCQDTNWSQVGGANQPIHVYIPQSNSGTLSFWLKAIGLTQAGSCANDLSNTLEENQGISRQFDDPSAIFIYSVADWVAQKYHSAPIGKKPAKGQNQFGSDEVGFLGLGSVTVGTTVYAPITTATVPTINATFSATKLTRTIYDVVRYTSSTKDHILSRLEPFLARTGYACSNKTAIAAIRSYGFLTLPSCGLAS